MRMRIDSTWLTAAIGIAAAGMALMYPSAGIALLVLAAAVLLAGVRVEDSHIIWLSKGTHRRYIGIALLCAAIGAGGWYFWTQCYCDGNLPPPAPSRLPLQSRYGAWVFVCATRPIDFEDWAQFYKANVLSKDNNDGFLVSISTTPDGLHFEKEALTEKAKK
jgi:hypothetical protein